MSHPGIGPVVLVGPGKMGGALARGWLAAGLDPSDLVLVHPRPSEALTQFASDVGATISAVVPAKPAGVLVLAVKPQKMAEVLPTARVAISTDTLVMSVAAGISIETLARELHTGRVIRTMPNTPVQVGKGVIGAVAGPGVTENDMAAAEELLGSSGEVVWLDDEAQIDALTAISGSGPAYVFYFVEALAAAGAKLGLDQDLAMALARQTVIGAAGLLEADPAPASVLRENVTSPKGVTFEALKILMAEDGMQPLLDKAVAAARARSVELGK